MKQRVPAGQEQSVICHQQVRRQGEGHRHRAHCVDGVAMAGVVKGQAIRIALVMGKELCQQPGCRCSLGHCCMNLVQRCGLA